MEEEPRPRGWSPKWEIAVVLVAIAGSGSAGKIAEYGSAVLGWSLGAATVAGCALALGRLAGSARRGVGALAVPLFAGLMVADAVAPGDTSGWFTHFLALVGTTTVLWFALDLWLARCDHVRRAS